MYLQFYPLVKPLLVLMNSWGQSPFYSPFPYWATQVIHLLSVCTDALSTLILELSWCLCLSCWWTSGIWVFCLCLDQGCNEAWSWEFLVECQQIFEEHWWLNDIWHQSHQHLLFLQVEDGYIRIYVAGPNSASFHCWWDGSFEMTEHVCKVSS